MILTVLLLAGIASHPIIRLRRRCAPARESAALLRPTQVLRLLYHDSDLAKNLAPTLSVARRAHAGARSPHPMA
jgi:hypothetical protein